MQKKLDWSCDQEMNQKRVDKKCLVSDPGDPYYTMGKHWNNGISQLKHRESGAVAFVQENLSTSLDLIDHPGQNVSQNTDDGHEYVTRNSDKNIYYNTINVQPVLKPLYFEVPQASLLQLVGRDWVFERILRSKQHVLVEGGSGSGKTALILSLVEKSCFGTFNKSEVSCPNRKLSEHVVGYHFCQSDNSPTCHVSEFVHSLAAQLSQCPQLSAYHHLLQSDVEILHHLSHQHCQDDPDHALLQGILVPLSRLEINQDCFILIDGLCEAEQHRPDYGDTLGTFILRHLDQFPSWLRLVVTRRTGVKMYPDLNRGNIEIISLDPCDDCNKDISDYITDRCLRSPAITANVQIRERDSDSGNFLNIFTSHLVKKAAGCFLYVKLLLDFLEKGHIVIKSNSFKLLPQSLSEMYQLAFNLIFNSPQSYEPIANIFSICLASLKPLHLEALYKILGSTSLTPDLSWDQFLTQYNLISQFLVTRADKSLMFCHPTLRDWLVTRRKSQDESQKFSINKKSGHTALVMYFVRSQTLHKPSQVLDLAHHILKANIHRNSGTCSGVIGGKDLQSLFLSMSVTDITSALSSSTNIFTPSLKISNLLLLAGADPNIVTQYRNGSSLLGIYSHLGYTDMVILLLEWGADVNHVNDDGDTALVLAGETGHADIVEILVKCGADLEEEIAVKTVKVSAREGHLDVVMFILDQLGVTSGSVEKCDKMRLCLSALVAAAVNKQKEIVQILLNTFEIKIADVDPDTMITPLIAAVHGGDSDIVQMMMDHGNNSGDDPIAHVDNALLLAASLGHVEVVQLLLDQGGDVNICDSSGRSPLMMSSSSGYLDVVEKLVRRGAVLENVDDDGDTAASLAVTHGHCQVVRFLVETGVDVDSLDPGNRSALEIAIIKEDDVMIDVVLDLGADIERVDDDGITPLTKAVDLKKPEIVTLLLYRGAKIQPETWRLALGKTEIILILLNKLLEEGNNLYRNYQYKEASLKYRHALDKHAEMDDDNSDNDEVASLCLKRSLLLNLSRSERRQGLVYEAVEAATKVIEIVPDSTEALVTRAKAYKASDMIKEAVEDYAQALKTDPTNKPIYLEFLKLREELKMLMKIQNTAFCIDSYDSIAYIDDTETNCSSI